MELSIKQKEMLAQFFCNYSITWFAGGIVAPFVAGWQMGNTATVLVSVTNIAIAIVIMLYLV